MERKLHMNVEIDNNNISKFMEETHGIKVIRSFELVTIAYEQGLFREYYLDLHKPKKILLEGLLWAVKLNGCSVSEQEIKEVIKIEKL